MHVFLDESGIFANPNGSINAPSCVAALGIPDRNIGSLYREFESWKMKEFGSSAEKKAKDLDERQVDAVLRLVAKSRATLEVVIFDPAIHSAGAVGDHRAMFSKSLTGGLDGRHSQEIWSYFTGLQKRVDLLNDQLYAQAKATMTVINNFIQTAIVEYWDSHPTELGKFKWIVDCKDPVRRTEMEDLWKSLILPVLQSKSEPFETPDWNGDDHPFNKAYGGALPDAPLWLFKNKEVPKGPFHFIRHGLILKDLHFEDSARSTGVQLADVAATSLRRALKGTIKIDGVRRLGRLVVRRRSSSFHFMTLEKMKDSLVTQRIKAYEPALAFLHSKCRTCAIHS